MSKKILRSINKGFEETEKGELKEKASSKRWEVAQDSEEDYWEGYNEGDLEKESGDRYPKKAEILLKEWSKFVKIDKNTKILQIGCGPEDVINYFKKGKLYSVDPLADFYKKKFKWNYKKSGLKKGRGEEIPFKDNFFDVVILINVLDHVEDPIKVFSEAKRVMKDKGIFHFENYIYQKRFIQMAKFQGKIKEKITKEPFNIHHPYMFTANDLRVLLKKKFEIDYEEIARDIGLYENIEGLKKRVLGKEKLPRRILIKLGLLGIINYAAICKKK